VNGKLVRSHVRCQKSRMRPNNRYPNADWFGAPGSDKFLRCYEKPQVGAYRIELQMNAKFLEAHAIRNAGDFPRLDAIVARQIVFFRVDWRRLSAYVRRNLRYSDVILRKARERKGNLDQLLRFLREVTVSNPERFLVRMTINENISQALRKWNKQWQAEGRRK
jgi:hypothetical protein